MLLIKLKRKIMGLLPQLSPTDVLVLTCPLCPFHSYLLNTIEEHFDEAHPDKMSEFVIYRCVHCHKVSTCRRFMLEHITLLHNTTTTTSTPNTATEEPESNQTNCNPDLQSITASTLSSISIYFSGKLYSKNVTQNKCSDKDVNSCNSPEQSLVSLDNADSDSLQISPTKTGLTNGLLKQLTLKHNANVNNTCIFCTSYFLTFQELQSHYASHHGIRNINNATTICNNSGNNEEESGKTENDENYQANHNSQISNVYHRNGEISKTNSPTNGMTLQSKPSYLSSSSNQNPSPLPLTANNSSNLASKTEPIITSCSLNPTPLDFLTALNNSTVNSNSSPLKNLAGQLQTKSTLFNLIMQQQHQQQFNAHTPPTQLLLSPPICYNAASATSNCPSSMINGSTTSAGNTPVSLSVSNNNNNDHPANSNNNNSNNILASAQTISSLSTNPVNTPQSLDATNIGPAVGMSLPFPITGKVPRLPQNSSNNTPPPPHHPPPSTSASSSSSSWLFTNPATNLSQLSAQLSHQLASPILNSLHNQFQNNNSNNNTGSGQIPAATTNNTTLNQSNLSHTVSSANTNVAALLHQQMMQAAYVATLAANNNNNNSSNNNSCSTTSSTPTTSPNTASTNNNDNLAANMNNNSILSEQLQLFHMPKLFPNISNPSNVAPLSSSVFSTINDNNNNNNSSIDLSTNSSSGLTSSAAARIKHEKTISGSESDRSSVSLSPSDRSIIPPHTNNSNNIHDSINGAIDMGIEIASNNSSTNGNVNSSAANNNNSSNNNNGGSNSLDDNQIYSMKRVVGISRTNLPFQARKILFSWLTSHLREPYPSEEEKIRLANETGLSRTTVNNWFINARRRYVKPLLQGKIGLTSGVLKSMLENSSNPNVANALVNGTVAPAATTANGINAATTNNTTSTPTTHNKRKMITPNPIIDGSFLNTVTNNSNKRRLIQSPNNNNNNNNNNHNNNNNNNNNGSHNNLCDEDVRQLTENNNNNEQLSLDHQHSTVVAPTVVDDVVKYESKLNQIQLENNNSNNNNNDSNNSFNV